MARWSGLPTPVRRCLIVASLAAAGAAVGLRLLAARWPAAVERVHAAVLPVLSGAVARLSARVGFALAEAAVLGLAAGTAVAVVVLAARVARGRLPPGTALLRLVRVPLLLAGPAYLWFLLSFGLAYERSELASGLGWNLDAPTRDELFEAAQDLIAGLTELRDELPEDRAGVLALDAPRALSGAPEGLAALGVRHPRLAPPSSAARPKCVGLSRALTLVGLAGIYSPFTLEPLVNCEAPTPYLPFVATHELLHASGVAREAEADFLAYVACREHPRAEFRYSGCLAALMHVRGALARVDPAAAQQVLAALEGGPRRDLDALWAFWHRHSGPLQELGARVNDTYLKSHGVAAGIGDYGRMVELIVAERRGRPAPARPR